MTPTCACCGRSRAAAGPDPRLPRLQVDACWDCRDVIARIVGWWSFNRLTWLRIGSPMVKFQADRELAAA